jgi:hypothetical protein
MNPADFILDVVSGVIKPSVAGRVNGAATGGGSLAEKWERLYGRGRLSSDGGVVLSVNSTAQALPQLEEKTQPNGAESEATHPPRRVRGFFAQVKGISAQQTHKCIYRYNNAHAHAAHPRALMHMCAHVNPPSLPNPHTHARTRALAHASNTN